MLRSGLALIQQVKCVGQPQRPYSETLHQRNTHLGLTATRWALENPVLGSKDIFDSFLLVGVERHVLTIVNLNRCPEGA